jgi:hypothetical protein
VQIVRKAVKFLAPPRDWKQESGSFSSSDNRLMISKGEGIPVALVRDDEYEDRCFMVVGPGNLPIVRFSFTGEDFQNLVEALDQVEQDNPPKLARTGGHGAIVGRETDEPAT